MDDIRVIGTCPPSNRARTGHEYREMVLAAVRWAEANRWHAVLIYTSNSLADPWAVAQFILQNTSSVRPLVAVQPIYSHPFTLANQVLTLSSFHGRQVLLNLVAGDYARDRAALGDTTPHDRRYDRLIEYGSLVTQLLGSALPVSFTGNFYSVDQLSLFARLPAPLLPELTVSGSSPSGLAAAGKLGACAIQYPRPSHEYGSKTVDGSLRHGLRIGLVARQTTEAAWAAAHRRYPATDEGRRIRAYAENISDSVWVKELSKEVSVPAGHPYWLGPYRNFQSSCPFLVGSIADVAAELAAYVRIGFKTFLLETPDSQQDSDYANAALSAARQLART